MEFLSEIVKKKLCAATILVESYWALDIALDTILPADDTAAMHNSGEHFEFPVFQALFREPVNFCYTKLSTKSDHSVSQFCRTIPLGWSDKHSQVNPKFALKYKIGLLKNRKVSQFNSKKNWKTCHSFLLVFRWYTKSFLSVRWFGAEKLFFKLEQVLTVLHVFSNCDN